MHKTICDACGESCTGSHTSFSYLCHLDDISPEYSDSKGNATSVAEVSVDLCRSCYNLVMGIAVKKFKAIQEERYRRNTASFLEKSKGRK